MMVYKQNSTDLLISQMEKLQVAMIDEDLEGAELLETLAQFRRFLGMDVYVDDLTVLRCAIQYIQRLSAVVNQMPQPVQ